MSNKNTQAQQAIKAALMSPESGITEPKRAKQSSFSAQVLDLDPGQAACRAQMVAPNVTPAELHTYVNMVREQMRNGCSPAIKRAKQAIEGSDYTTEIGFLVMPAMTMYVVAIVTRVA